MRPLALALGLALLLISVGLTPGSPTGSVQRTYGAPVTTVYSSGDLNLAIPDWPGAGVTNTINVPDSVLIDDVDVRIRVNHGWISDVIVKIQSPAGTVRDLVTRVNGNDNTDNFGTGPASCSATAFTIFDDEAPGPATGNHGPFAGSYTPEQPLSALDGQNALGAWTITVSDGDAIIVGSFHCWQLVVTAVEPATSTPTATATATATSTSTATATATSTSTATATPTATSTSTSTATAASTPTSTATGTLVLLTSTPTATATSTPTLSPTATTTPLATSTATSTATATPTVGSTATATPSPTTAVVQAADPESRPLTETQRIGRDHTNTAGHDDYSTEGNVVFVDFGSQPPTVTIGTKDGLQTLVLHCGRECPRIQVGDYIEAEGEKQSEVLFDAYEVSVSR